MNARKWTYFPQLWNCLYSLPPDWSLDVSPSPPTLLKMCLGFPPLILKATKARYTVMFLFRWPSSFKTGAPFKIISSFLTFKIISNSHILFQYLHSNSTKPKINSAEKNLFYNPTFSWPRTFNYFTGRKILLFKKSYLAFI